MDQAERQRRLRAYGFSEPADVEPGPTIAAAGPDPEPADGAEPVPAADPRPRPSVFARVRDSWAFRYGLTVLVAAFAVSVLLGWDVIPEGPWVVEPAAGAEVAGADVELAKVILEDRLSPLDIEAGARLFDEHAETHLYVQFAIVLDGIVESAPSINATRYGGQAQISGDFTIEEASALVAALQAGRSLPYPVSVSFEA